MPSVFEWPSLACALWLVATFGSVNCIQPTPLCARPTSLHAALPDPACLTLREVVSRPLARAGRIMSKALPEIEVTAMAKEDADRTHGVSRWSTWGCGVSKFDCKSTGRDRTSYRTLSARCQHALG